MIDPELIPRDAEDERSDTEILAALPPEDRELVVQGIKSAEQLMRFEERKRRARLTFWAPIVILTPPLVAIVLALCFRLFSIVAGTG